MGNPAVTLIIEENKTLCDQIAGELTALGHTPEKAHTVSEATAILNRDEVALYAVFLNLETDQNSAITLMKLIFQKRPVAKIYITTDKDLPKDLPLGELKKNGIIDILKKPFDAKLPAAILGKRLESFSIDKAMSVAEPDTGEDTAKVYKKEDFTQIKAKDFIAGSKSFFDVYVNVPPDKYIKLLKAGDAFTTDRIANYLKKGVSVFYIRKEAQKLYMDYCEVLTNKLLRGKETTTEVRVSQLLNFGEQVQTFLQKNGVSPANLEHGRRFIGGVKACVEHLPKNQHSMAFKTFFNNLVGYEHGVSTSLLAGMLANSLEIKMDRPVQIVGMAALFHDIALYQMPEKFWKEDVSVMTTAERLEYEKHPDESAKILSGVPGIEPGTIQAVAQHHMRIGGQGFPPKADKVILNKISEIIGICDEFDRLIKEYGKTSVGLHQLVEKNIYPHFSKQIIYAFRSTFFPREK